MNDISPPHPITEQAIKAIGEDDPGSDWILRPEEHASALPPEAGALKRILGRTEHLKTVQEYRANDGTAQRAQTRYKRVCHIGLGAALGATVIGAIFLLLPAKDSLQNLLSKEMIRDIRLFGTGLEYLLLLVAFLAERYNAYFRPFDLWMKARARAEIARAKLFDDVKKATEAERPDELPLLPLKLEYFRRYQFDVQRRFYRGRGDQHRQAARRIRRLQVFSFALAGVVGIVALADSLSLLDVGELQPLFAWYKSLGRLFAPLNLDGEKGLIALGAIASAIYGFAAALSLLSLHDRNGVRYQNSYDTLNLLGENLFRQAQNEAAGNRHEDAFRFIDSAQALISCEHQEWVRWRDWAPEPDVRAVYIILPK